MSSEPFDPDALAAGDPAGGDPDAGNLDPYAAEYGVDEYGIDEYGGPDRRGVPTKLMAGLLDNPLGLPSATPRLWWQVPVLPGIGGGEQVAYELELARDPRGFDPDAPIETTGEVSSPQSTAVPWPFPPLAPRSVAYWRVRTYAGTGRRTNWSDPQRLVTGPAPDDWAGAVAVWADLREPTDLDQSDPHDQSGPDDQDGAADPGGPDPSDPTNWALIRHEFDLPDGELVAAVAHVTAQSPEGAAQFVYRMWCNDTHIGVGPARSADVPHYQSHDLLPVLHAGERNAVAFCCWTRSDRRLQAVIDIHYADGRVHTVVSGPDWQGRHGGRYLSATGDLRTSYYVAPNEAIDARYEPIGWRSPGYPGDDFRPVRTGPLITDARPTETAEIERRELPPAAVTLPARGRWLVDTGREIVGGLRITLDVPESLAGTTVRVLLGEERKPDGKVRFKLRAQTRYHEDWTLRAGRQVLEHWGYRAFRWAELRTSTELDLSRAVTILEHVAPAPEPVASFESSDENLNRVWELCAHTILANRQDLYMDTPTRERLAYESDLLSHARCEMALARSYDLGRYSTHYVVRRPQWPTEFKFMGIAAAWENYLETGDPDALDADFDRHRALQGERWLDSDGLINKEPGTPPGPRDIVDWPPSQRDDYVFTNVNTVVNAWQYHAFGHLARAAEATGRTDEAQHYDELAKRLRTAINERFYDAETGAYLDGEGTDHTSQHAAMYAVALGVAPERELGRIGDWLTADTDRPVRVSASAALWLLGALFATGKAERALEILTSRRRESWRAMMDDWGATMTMEAWSPELKPNTTFSHPWAAGPVAVVARQLLGVRVLTPGAATIEVAPELAGLARVSGVVATVRGPVTVQAEQDPGYGVTVEVPGNTSGTLRWPMNGADPKRFRIETSGTPHRVRADGDLLVVDLHAGYTTVVRE